MYSFIIGNLVELYEDKIVLENSGIGYEIATSLRIYQKLVGKTGEKIKIYTYLSVREDDMSLFGFETVEEKNLFLQLITVSGVGAKTALGMLSSLSASDIVTAIALQDPAVLSKAKGIGKKTAERIILELKGKVSAEYDIFDKTPSSNTAMDSIAQDAILALVSLGILESEAVKQVKKLRPNATSTEELIKLVLKNRAR